MWQAITTFAGEIDSLLRHHVPDTLSADDGGDTKRDVNSTIRVNDSLDVTRVFWSENRCHWTGACRCFAAVWYVAHKAVQSKLQKNVESQMQTVLNADVAAIEIWLAKQKQMAENWANH